MLLTNNGDLLWSTPIYEMGISVVSAFDFTGDGHPEFVAADEASLMVYRYDGVAVQEEYRTEHSGLLQYRTPVIAGLDFSGTPSVVLAASEVSCADNIPNPQFRGIRVHTLENMPEVIARKVWHQLPYLAQTVTESLSIMPESPQTETLNSWVQEMPSQLYPPPPACHQQFFPPGKVWRWLQRYPLHMGTLAPRCQSWLAPAQRFTRSGK